MRLVRIGPDAFDLDFIVALHGTRVVFRDGKEITVSKAAAQRLLSVLPEWQVGQPVPCPSCKSENLTLLHGMGEVWVKCLGCGKTGPMHATPDRAIAEWNKAAEGAK